MTLNSLFFLIKARGTEKKNIEIDRMIQYVIASEHFLMWKFKDLIPRTIEKNYGAYSFFLTLEQYNEL